MLILFLKTLMDTCHWYNLGKEIESVVYIVVGSRQTIILPLVFVQTVLIGSMFIN